MFKSLSLFSAVPCPDRNKCSLINCIFSHELKTAPITLPPALAVDLEPPRNPSYRERSCDSTDSSLNGGVSLDSIAEEEANGQGRSKRRRVDERYGGSGSDSSAGGGGGGGVSLAAIAGPGVGDAKRTDAKKAKGVVPDVMTGIQLSQQKVSPSKKLAHKKTPLQQAPAAVASILDTGRSLFITLPYQIWRL